MKRSSLAMVLACAGVVIFGACFIRYAWLRQVTRGPFQLLWDSSQSLNNTLFDVSEQPVLSAGRRLLEPFGHLSLLRIITVPADQLHSRVASSSDKKSR